MRDFFAFIGFVVVVAGASALMWGGCKYAWDERERRRKLGRVLHTLDGPLGWTIFAETPQEAITRLIAPTQPTAQERSRSLPQVVFPEPEGLDMNGRITITITGNVATNEAELRESLLRVCESFVMALQDTDNVVIEVGGLTARIESVAALPSIKLSSSNRNDTNATA